MRSKLNIDKTSLFPTEDLTKCAGNTTMVQVFSLPQWVRAIRQPHMAKNIGPRRHRKQINHMKNIGGDLGERFERRAIDQKVEPLHMHHVPYASSSTHHTINSTNNENTFYHTLVM